MHILETLHGLKIYDFFTYCAYRFRIRRRKWIAEADLDRSIAHRWRSLDNMSFSSQYYYIVSITTYGILFLYLGMTSMIRNEYNPFGDVVLIGYCAGLGAAVWPVSYLLTLGAHSVKLWEDFRDEGRIRIDVSSLNRLDKTNSTK